MHGEASKTDLLLRNTTHIAGSLINTRDTALVGSGQVVVRFVSVLVVVKLESTLERQIHTKSGSQLFCISPEPLGLVDLQ